MKDEFSAKIRDAEERAAKSYAKQNRIAEAQRRNMVDGDVVPVILADGRMLRGVVQTHPGSGELPPRVVEAVDSTTVSGMSVPSLSDMEVIAILSETKTSTEPSEPPSQTMNTD